MDKLTKHLSKVTYPKGYHILEAGKTETNIFFIEKGIVRAYIPVDGKEVTFWIGKEGSAIVSLKSYVDPEQSGVIAENAVGMSCFLSGNNSGKFEPDQGKAEADALKKLIKKDALFAL